jgi:CDP-glycerol glycerophosphotransferase (TagB/SpsB family)
MDSQEIQKIKNQLVKTDYENDLKIVSQKKPKVPMVLFFGRDNFSDNSKYLFLDASRNNYGFEPLWCSFNPQLVQELLALNLNAVDLSINAGKNIAFLIKAPLCVFTISPNESLQISAYAAALAGAQKVQLWHGVGTKQLDLALTDKADLGNPGFVHQLVEASSIDYILSPAQTWDRQWREFFGVRKIIRAGMPRNEVLTRKPLEQELVGSYKKVFKSPDAFKILWAPSFTYIGDQPMWMNQSIYEKILAPFHARKIKVELVIKPHPYDSRLENEIKNNPLVISPGPDIYPYLNQVDLLITDKSSIFTDFLHCNKPIIFIKNNRINETDADNIFMSQLPGVETELHSVGAAVERVLTRDEFVQIRAELKSKAFDTSAADACKEINSYFAELVPTLVA